MGIRDNPRWIEYCQTTNKPSLRKFVHWDNKHEQLIVEQEILIIEECRGK